MRKCAKVYAREIETEIEKKSVYTILIILNFLMKL